MYLTMDISEKPPPEEGTFSEVFQNVGFCILISNIAIFSFYALLGGMEQRIMKGSLSEKCADSEK